MVLVISSTAFKDGEYIPARHTCKGQNASPPLAFSGIPEKARSLALILDDPDAPQRTFTHWVIFNLPPGSRGLAEGMPTKGQLAGSALQGKNDAGSLGYHGPCPPPGKPHRYYFKLYALDRLLDLKAGVGKTDLLRAMEGHVLAEAQLMGLFQR